MRTRALTLLLLGALLANDAQSQLRRRAAGDDARRSLTHRGRDRTYVVRAPRDLSRDGSPDASRPVTPLPVVLVLHGGGGNAANAEQMTGFTRYVDTERVLVVYPEGTGRRADRLLTWNAGHCCSYAMENRVDDVGFIAALLDALARDYPVDPRRIYVTGMSNGAMMSHRVGRELSPRIAAIAPVVGALFGDEPPARGPVAMLAINGMLDKAVPAQGGPTGGRSRREWDGTPTKPNSEQGLYWARANECLPTPSIEKKPNLVSWRYECPPGRAVELLQVTDNGHAWPGGQKGSRLGDTPSTAIDATAVIWTFFKAHPRAR